MSVVGKSLGAGAEHQARLPQRQHERNAPVCERHGNDLLPVPVPVHLWRRDVLRTFAGTQGAPDAPRRRLGISLQALAVRGVGPPSVQSMTPMSAKRSDATRLYVIASGTGSHPTDLAAEPRCRGGPYVPPLLRTAITQKRQPDTPPPRPPPTHT